MVEGTGEADPHEPEKQYDEKGRIINPHTKQAIKDTIRAHNEVMQTIGVAEPEPPKINEEEVALVREHQMYETDTGKTLLNIGRSLGILGIWGVHGTRQRVLVRRLAYSNHLQSVILTLMKLYRQYNHVPFLDLWNFERQNQSISQICFTGLPSFISMQALRWCSMYTSSIKDNML